MDGNVAGSDVTELNYYTDVESAESAASTVGGQPNYLGAQPQYLIVSMKFDAWRGSDVCAHRPTRCLAHQLDRRRVEIDRRPCRSNIRARTRSGERL